MTQPDHLNYESLAGRFQQRIGEITMRYEADIAIVHEQYGSQIAGLKQKIVELEIEIQDLKDAPVEGDE